MKNGNIIKSIISKIQMKPIESFFIELNFQNTRIPINCSYNPHKSETKTAFDSLQKFFRFTLLKIWQNFDFGWFKCGNRRRKYKIYEKL